MTVVDHRFALSMPALMSACSKKSFSSASSPILACSTLRSTGGADGRPSVPNTSAARSSNRAFHSVIWFGCTSNWLASSASVLSPRIAARATFALKAAEWLRRGRLLMFAPVSTGPIMPQSGSDSTYPAVQISGASSIETQLASLGSNLLVLRQGAVRIAGVAQEAGATTRLTIDDVAAIKEQIVGVKQASPSVRGRARVTFGNRNWNTQILGTGPEYEHMRAAQPPLGRFFTEAENQRRSRVALIGLTVVRELFGDQNPVGEYIKLNRINFQVIGILPEKGANAWRDQDDIVVIPVQTAMYRLLGKN